VDDRMLMAGAFGERRPLGIVATHRYVAARAFASTGRRALCEFVEVDGSARPQPGS
jgi:hypothetical protein